MSSAYQMENSQNRNDMELLEADDIHEDNEVTTANVNADGGHAQIEPPDGVHAFLGGILAGLQRLSPEMREVAKELIRAMLDQYLWADLNGLPAPVPPPLPRYSPHG